MCICFLCPGVSLSMAGTQSLKSYEGLLTRGEGSVNRAVFGSPCEVQVQPLQKDLQRNEVEYA